MNSKQLLMDFLIQRWKNPKGNSTFYIYFWLAIVGVGGAGIWAEVFPPIVKGSWDWNWAGIAAGLYTFFPAVAVASAFDLILPDKQMRSVRAFGVAVLLIALGWLFLCANIPCAYVAILTGAIGAVASLVVWRVANGLNPALQDFEQAQAETSIGGSDNNIPAGSDAGFSL